MRYVVFLSFGGGLSLLLEGLNPRRDLPAMAVVACWVLALGVTALSAVRRPHAGVDDA